MALTQQQRIDRQSGIGGSDSAAVVGISPWKSPYDVWESKTQPLPDEDGATNESMHWGNVLESVVRLEFERRNNIEVLTTDFLFRHKEYPFLIANVDGVINDKTGIEIKTASAYSADEWGDGPDDVPTYYLTQVLHYCAVMDWEQCYVAVLIGGNTYKQYLIKADKEVIDSLVKMEVDFWNNYVSPRIAPPMTGAELTKKWDKTDGSFVEATDSVVESVAGLRRCKSEVKELEAEIKELEREIKEAISGADELRYNGKAIATWKFNKDSVKFDAERFEAECAEIYKSYCRAVPGARVLRLK